MKLEHLISHQRKWEAERGIKNGHFNIPRIQVELDEAAAEEEPLKVLEELIDVQIILAGGIAKAAEAAGYQCDDINNMIEAKLRVNSLKYDQEIFDANPVDTAITFVRHYWKVDPDDWDIPNEIY